MIKKTNLFPKAAEVVAKSIPPDRGNIIIGSNAVTEIGSASVIHQIAIHRDDAKTALEESFKPTGLKKKNVEKNITGPKYSPIILEDISAQV
tara:strand:+ start:2159 stop:2434 length:276 start_codon:yes stop_codon:yes gene_type:complete